MSDQNQNFVNQKVNDFLLQETLVKLEVLTPEDSASISASADNQLLKVAFENVKPNLTYVWFNNFVGWESLHKD